MPLAGWEEGWMRKQDREAAERDEQDPADDACVLTRLAAENDRLRAEVARLINELMPLQSDPGYDEQRNVGADLAAGLILSVIEGKRPQLADGPLRAAVEAVAGRCDEVARLREALQPFAVYVTLCEAVETISAIAVKREYLLGVKEVL